MNNLLGQQVAAPALCTTKPPPTVEDDTGGRSRDLHDDRSSFTAEQSASASSSVSVRVGCSERQAVRDALLSRGHLRPRYTSNSVLEQALLVRRANSSCQATAGIWRRERRRR